jgi:hypothetical protein
MHQICANYHGTNNRCFFSAAKKSRPSSGTAPNYVIQNQLCRVLVPVMLILLFPEIGRHHPPPPLSSIRMFRPISTPKGRNSIISKKYANNN